MDIQSITQTKEQNKKIMRITYEDEKEEKLDEVVIEDLDSIHMERMNDNHIWMAVEDNNGERFVINLATNNDTIFGNIKREYL